MIIGPTDKDREFYLSNIVRERAKEFYLSSQIRVREFYLSSKSRAKDFYLSNKIKFKGVLFVQHG